MKFSNKGQTKSPTTIGKFSRNQDPSAKSLGGMSEAEELQRLQKPAIFSNVFAKILVVI